MKARSYDDKYEGNIEPSTIFNNRLQDLKNEIKVQLPCKVHSINHEKNQVSVEILDYDVDNMGIPIKYPIIPNVPIRQPLDSNVAYIRLPIQIGDIGTIEFFDTSVKDLIVNSTYDYDYSEEWHNLNNGLFTNGFLPKNKLFSYDYNSKIVIGTKNNIFVFKVNSDDTLTVSTPKMTLNGNLIINGNITHTGNMTSSGTITANTDVVGGGKSLKSHTHTDSQGGSTTSPN